MRKTIFFKIVLQYAHRWLQKYQIDLDDSLFFLFMPALPLKTTVKLVYNDRYWDSKIVAGVDRRSLFKENLCNKSSKGETKWWSL
jgi:hypothetical protein